MKYIRHYNKTPKTAKWRYFDPTRQHHSQFSRYRPLFTPSLVRLMFRYGRRKVMVGQRFTSLSQA